MFGAHYLGNGWRYRLVDNGAHIGNGHLGIEWTRDRLRHVIPKAQGRDFDMFDARYLENGLRELLGDNGAPIGNDHLGIKWSRDR